MERKGTAALSFPRLLVAGLVLIAIAGTNATVDDEITDLPGLPGPINFKQYAGYINVNSTNNRNLFYWFTESQSNPATDKLVLWLNGGPGCSSVSGMMTEQGPFRPQENGTLLINPSAWNNKANVIFLESPAGVGFSFSDVPSDYAVGDERTANDAYLFLLGFLERYPQYKNTPFWVTGESYAGHYVPQLVQRILTGNKENSVKINIQGFMVGNAWTYMPIDNAGAVFYWWSHALIADKTYTDIMSACNLSDLGPLTVGRPSVPAPSASYDPAACNIALQDANTQMSGIDIYDIYVDVCLSSHKYQQLEAMGRAGSPVHAAAAEAAMKRHLFPKAHQASYNDIYPPYEPCADDYVTTYLNRADVRKAIHATNITYPWAGCSSLVNYTRADVEASVIPLYQGFLAQGGLDILVYSGDVDAIVPVTGTRAWLAQLNLSITETWAPWVAPDNQVGGFVTHYSGLTFATVRNAGHMVPSTQPQRSLHLFNSFLYGTGKK